MARTVSGDTAEGVLTHRTDDATDKFILRNENHIEPQDLRTVARWLDALKRLKDYDLIKQYGDGNRYFTQYTLTHRGYLAADKLQQTQNGNTPPSA